MSEVHYLFFEAHIPKNARGFAEKHIRRKLEKKGYIVWRGGYLHAAEKPNQWPAVIKKYQQALNLLDEQGHDVYTLQHLCKHHKGMPDFLVYNKKEMYFVECKLEHEQLSSKQKRCIDRLEQLGLQTYVYKVCSQAKGRHWIKDTRTGEKIIKEQQQRIRKHY